MSTRTNILALGTTAANSRDIVVVEHQPVTISAFAASSFPAGVTLNVMIKTSGGDQLVGTLSTSAGLQANITAKGTYYVARGSVATAVGVDEVR